MAGGRVGRGEWDGGGVGWRWGGVGGSGRSGPTHVINARAVILAS